MKIIQSVKSLNLKNGIFLSYLIILILNIIRELRFTIEHEDVIQGLGWTNWLAASFMVWVGSVGIVWFLLQTLFAPSLKTGDYHYKKFMKENKCSD